MIGTSLAAIIGGGLLACMVGRAQSGMGAPTYYRDVVPMLRGHGEVCHRTGGIEPMSFATYEQAQRYADGIRFATQNKSMPPWFAVAGSGRFSNDPSLNGGEIATLAAWAAANAPAGDPRDAPTAPDRAEGWSIPRPQLIGKMTQPGALPAGGDVVGGGKCASGGGLHRAKGLERAAHCACGRRFNRRDSEGPGGPPRGSLDGQRYSAGVRAGKFAGRVAGDDGEICSRRIRS